MPRTAHKNQSEKLSKVLRTEGPGSVQGAKLVSLALVTYTDDQNRKITQLAVVGDKNIHLLEGKMMGFSNTTTPQGHAQDWLRDAIFAALDITPQEV